MKKRKILIIIPSLIAGGAERVLVNLLRTIDRSKYEISLFLGEDKGELRKDIPEDVKIFHIYRNKFLRKISELFYAKLGTPLLLKLFGRKIKGNFDVGISFLDSIASEFLFYNNAIITKKAIVIHSSYKSYDNYMKFIKGAYRKRLINRYSKVDTIISVAEEALSEFKELFGEFPDMRVIYNPMNIHDIKEKANDSTQIIKHSDGLKIVAVGNLLPVKGYDLLFEACEILKNKNVDFHLTVLGEGFLREELERLIQNLDLNDNITLKGFVRNPYPYVKDADIYVMTSVSEGLPTALCEALILGKPSLTVNVPGCREVVGNSEYGILVERTKKGIADGILQLCASDMREYYHEKALERAKIFNDEIAIGQYYNIFDA